MSKFAVAMAMFAALELLSWLTLSDRKVRLVAMAVIGMFALRTWAHHRRELLASASDVEKVGSGDGDR